MKKLSMKLDELQVESFEPEPEAEQESVKGYYGAGHTQTTCMQDICDCSAFPTDCDFTCPGYWNAAQASCQTCPDAGC